MIFISYSTKDKAIADNVCNALEKKGIRCWIAPRNVQPGRPYAREIVNGINSSSMLLLIFTSNSNKSEHVINEVDRAFNAKKTIVPFLAEDVAMNEELDYYLARKQWFIAYPNYKELLGDLVKTIADKLNIDIDIETETETSNIINGHEYVDLGLPSGLKWATCNLGASTPEEYGDFYAWGEMETKSDYIEESYIYIRRRERDIRYYLDQIFVRNQPYFYKGIGMDISGTKYDVAYKKWGSTWRIPRLSEYLELYDEENCVWEWTELLGVKGCKVTSRKNGNSIFLPAVGEYTVRGLNGEKLYGRYWLSTLDVDDEWAESFLICDNIIDDYEVSPRYMGCCIRPVSK